MTHLISAVVLEPSPFPRGAAGRALAVRSLGWLVGAAVAGVVGEVVLAAGSDLDLSAVADAVGSRLVEAEGEGRRLQAAAAAVRSDRVLVIVAGYAPDAAVIEELAQGGFAAARLLAEPETFIQRLRPAAAPAAGVLVPAATLSGIRDFAALARAHRRAPALLARARRLH